MFCEESFFSLFVFLLTYVYSDPCTSSFDITPKCFQLTTKIKNLVSLLYTIYITHIHLKSSVNMMLLICFLISDSPQSQPV